MRQVVNRKLAGNRPRKADGETSPAPEEEEAAAKDYDEGDDESYFADFEEVSIAAGLKFDDDRTAASLENQQPLEDLAYDDEEEEEEEEEGGGEPICIKHDT